MSSLGLGVASATPVISIIKPWSSWRRQPGALNSHLINQRTIKMYEHPLTLGFLASFEMLKAALASVCALCLTAGISLHPPYTLAVMLSPWGLGWGGGQSFISVQLSPVQLSDRGDG